ncbi:N-acetylglucosaminylphosphatidylinositol deacetylase [Saccharomycopsis crataegensis]|uniref:N-acetylglucosaminylphosphatidylinositol deacetylase n=1 Tax=Saccharomycopsis crataegensis TaxID=43959 RepID=A0AAV5QVL1_9ASCO|nr:N-acetylglucosaminylphosphatidylinositol deacetylase [Saccharomycopsis crataegensis]
MSILCVVPKKLIKCFMMLNAIWIILSTVIPNLSKNDLFKAQIPSETLNRNQLINSNIYYVIAHPDDEVMFFAPSIIELGKKKHNNTLGLICFSNGNADGLGEVRASELVESARIFGIDESNVHQIIDEENFMDSMNTTWESSKISKKLSKIITKDPNAAINLITFDEAGVSDHPNHKSLYYGCKEYLESSGSSANLFKLNSLSFFEKYSFTLVTSKILIAKYFKVLQNILEKSDFVIPIALSDDKSSSPEVLRFFSDLPSAILTVGAMSFAHASQMVWFRWGWLLFSRFGNFNELIKVQ